jgi:hypothetical protein
VSVNGTRAFVEGRANPGLPVDHLEDALGAVARAFGEEWLTAKKDHPLRRLWRRGDFLATNELYWLGDSFMRLSANERWIGHAVERIKLPNRNDRVGLTFEVLGLAAFATSDQKLALPSANNPDWDGELSVGDGPRYRLSVKNFGESSRDGEFRKKSEEATALILDFATHAMLPWIHVKIETSEYPDSGVWRKVMAAIPTAIRSRGQPLAGDSWQIIASDTRPASEHPLDPYHLSYSVLAIGPRHPNERKNFLDKIEAACLSFDKAARAYDANTFAMPLIRLSENAPIEAYVEYAREYLTRDEVALAGLWLYQCSVAVDMKADTTGLHHFLIPIIRASHAAKLPSAHVPVGIVDLAPTKAIFYADGKEISTDGYHTFWRQELFEEHHIGADGGEATIRQLPGGVRHAVLVLPDGSRGTFSPGRPSYGHVELFL